MSLPYFYAAQPSSGELDGAEAKHAHVKRIGPGEHIMLVDGHGNFGSLDDGPALYETFQKKEDGCIKVVLKPQGV